MSERMQALLSRAVEDQLSEQRQLAGAIGDFRAQLGQLARELESMRNQPEQSERLDAVVAAVSADVRDAVRLLGERIDHVTRQVQDRGRDLGELRGVIAEVQATVGQHAQALAGVAGGLTALPSFGDRIGALQDGLAAVHDRLHGVEELTGALAQVSHRVDTVDTGVRELRGAFAGIASRVSDLPARGDVDGVVRAAVQPLDALGERLGALEAALPAVTERLDRLDAGVDAQTDLLESVRGRLSDVAAAAGGDTETPERLARVEAALAGVRSRMEELAANPARDPRVDELVAAVDELHDGLFGDDGLESRIAALGGAAAAPADLDARISETVERVVGESERRLAEHVDEAILALAEALLRRKAVRPPVMPSPMPYDEMLATGPIPVVPATAPGPAAAASPAPPAPPPPPAPPAPQAAAPPEPVAEPEPEAIAEPEAVVEPEPVAEPEPEAIAEPEALVEPEPEPVAGLEPEPLADVAPEPVVTAEPPAAEPQPVDLTRAADGGRERWEPPAPARPEPVDATTANGARRGDDADAARRRRPWWRPTD